MESQINIMFTKSELDLLADSISLYETSMKQGESTVFFATTRMDLIATLVVLQHKIKIARRELS